MLAMQYNFVFFLDIDNTLLDNDSIKEEIRRSLVRVLGEVEANHFWDHHDSFRQEKKLVDFPNIIREYCAEKHAETCELKLSQIFQGIEFKDAIYSHVPQVLAHLKTFGKVVIFSEGDMVYQREKIEKSGIAAMTDGVFLYKHKLDHLEQIMKRHSLYKKVFIEDRLDTLVTIKQKYPTTVTIVVCQGHYSNPDCPTKHEGADLAIERISNLLSFSSTNFTS